MAPHTAQQQTTSPRAVCLAWRSTTLPGRVSTVPSDLLLQRWAAKSRPEEIEAQCDREHGSESDAVAGDSISGVMNAQGDERDRDTNRHRDCGETGDEAQDHAAWPPRSGDQDRGGEGHRGHYRGVTAGERQVSVAQSPDEWLSDQ